MDTEPSTKGNKWNQSIFSLLMELKKRARRRHDKDKIASNDKEREKGYFSVLQRTGGGQRTLVMIAIQLPNQNIYIRNPKKNLPIEDIHRYVRPTIDDTEPENNSNNSNNRLQIKVKTKQKGNYNINTYMYNFLLRGAFALKHCLPGTRNFGLHCSFEG